MNMQKKMAAAFLPLLMMTGLASTATPDGAVTAANVAASHCRDYTVSFKTADRDGAGTDGAVYVQINGTNGSTAQSGSLDNVYKDDFERGGFDTFKLKCQKDVGKPLSVTVWFNDRGGRNAEWKLAYIVVNDRYYFPAHVEFYKNNEVTYQWEPFGRANW